MILLILHRLFKERKMENRSGNVNYEHKLPTEYSRAQRRYNWFVILVLSVLFIVAVYFVFHGQYQDASIVTSVIVVVWFFLIKLGNKIK